jgi:hypothetical protein
MAVCMLALCGSAAAQPARTIKRTEYTDRMRAMWLGQCIANWTGLRTEGKRTQPPFFTDADWGTTPPGLNQPIDFVLNQNPWRADDDTDIEYVYLHLMTQHGRPLLTGEEIRAGWLLHMNPQYIWVSNHRAWELMHRNMTPPATSLPGANNRWAFIDAQLTTEFFGLFAPGMPEAALQLAELPIRTTAAGHAAHAAQYFAVLYSLALEADPALSGHDRALWLALEARKWIPDSSKSAAAVDLVVQDFLANPDLDDWERTRDLVYTVFQLNAAANGYQYRGWTESTINFAAGIVALLYGGCDFKRTVQIGTLSGWDSDNSTATLGGMIGLMLGMQGLQAQFPGQVFSDRFDIYRTRWNLPDYLPADPAAQDTFTMMAARMRPIVEQVVIDAGGHVDAATDSWVLPPRIDADHLSHVPGVQAQAASANNRVRAQGGTVQALSSVVSSPPTPASTHGTAIVARIANGFEHDWSGIELPSSHGQFYSTRGATVPPGGTVTLSILYDREVDVHFIRFIEGDHFEEDGGWFQSAALELRIGGQWQPVPTLPGEALDSQTPFQIIDWVLPASRRASGVRITGEPGGLLRFVTALELDLFSGPCYANCDNSTTPPVLNVEDFTCFINAFAHGLSLPAAEQIPHYANCDGSTTEPILNVEDFACFINAFAASCH